MFNDLKYSVPLLSPIPALTVAESDVLAAAPLPATTPPLPETALALVVSVPMAEIVSGAVLLGMPESIVSLLPRAAVVFVDAVEFETTTPTDKQSGSTDA